MVLTSQDLLGMVFGALTVSPDTTAAQNRVYKPGDWPTQPGLYPVLKLRLVSENRVSLGGSGPSQFTTTAVVRIVGEVSAPAEAENMGASQAENDLWALKRQAEIAVINSYPLTSSIQDIPSMSSQIGFDSSGPTHLAVVQVDLALEFYEGPESFAPVDEEDLDQVDASLVDHPPYGITVVLPQ